MRVEEEVITEWAEAASTAGVYKLVFPTGVYVGASFTVDIRVEGHLQDLVAGKHKNRLLQHVYNREKDQLRVQKRFLPITSDFELASFERVLLREVFLKQGQTAVLNKAWPQPVGRTHPARRRRAS
jgi:hypothetical protein